MIKKIIPVFSTWNPVFRVPFGYFFVRRMVDIFASEYYLFPFNLIMRLYYYVKKKKTTVDKGGN